VAGCRERGDHLSGFGATELFKCSGFGLNFFDSRSSVAHSCLLQPPSDPLMKQPVTVQA
jgi:hypothetical protein